MLPHIPSLCPPDVRYGGGYAQYVFGKTDLESPFGKKEENGSNCSTPIFYDNHRDAGAVLGVIQEDGCRKEAVIGDAEISVHLPLEPLPLTPTHMSLTQVIYYLEKVQNGCNFFFYFYTDTGVPVGRN